MVEFFLKSQVWSGSVAFDVADVRVPLIRNCDIALKSSDGWVEWWTLLSRSLMLGDDMVAEVHFKGQKFNPFRRSDLLRLAAALKLEKESA